MRIDDGAKREILARTNIAEYIGQFVKLRRTRNDDYLGLCPFHGEKSPSFHVHGDRGFFKCFGCGVGGDVIKFIQLHDNLTFPDALRVLAKRAGVELEAENPAAARARSEKEAIYHANEIAAAFYNRLLTIDPRGAAARAYCAGRGIAPEIHQMFGRTAGGNRQAVERADGSAHHQVNVDAFADSLERARLVGAEHPTRGQDQRRFGFTHLSLLIMEPVSSNGAGDSVSIC